MKSYPLNLKIALYLDMKTPWDALEKNVKSYY